MSTECERCRELEEQLKRETQRRKDLESERNVLKSVTDRVRRRDPVLFREIPETQATPPPSVW